MGKYQILHYVHFHVSWFSYNEATKSTSTPPGWNANPIQDYMYLPALNLLDGYSLCKENQFSGLTFG